MGETACTCGFAAEVRLARPMSAHLAAFVVRGDPAAEACSECDMAQQAWPAYTLAAPASLELDPTSAGVPTGGSALRRRRAK